MEENKKEHPEGCMCMACRGKMWSECHGWKFHFLKGLIIALILVVVFWLGVKVGEYRDGYYGRGWHGAPYMYRMMWGDGGYGYGPGMMGGYGRGFYGPGMMNGWYGGRNSTSTQSQ